MERYVLVIKPCCRKNIVTIFIRMKLTAMIVVNENLNLSVKAIYVKLVQKMEASEL